MSVSRTVRVLGAAALLGLSAQAHAQIARLGAMGDSLSDEYSEETYSYATNWTMQLVTYRAVNMGPTAAQAAQPGGTWGEPRRTGYESNWARSGADSATLLSQGQASGLAAQAASKGVTHAVLAIGANDFSPDTSAYFNIYWGFWSSAQTTTYVNQRVANVRAAIEAVQPSGIQLVLCNYVDYGVAPVTRSIFTSASRRDRVSAAVKQVNDQLLPLAYEKHLVHIDINALGTAIFGTNSNLRTTLLIGNVAIQLQQKDTTSHTNPYAGFVDDGAHPHTTLQGVFANVMAAALDAYSPGSIATFTDAEILQHAGLSYVGPDTLESQIGPPTKYVRNFHCLADIDANGFVNGDDFDQFSALFNAGDPGADIDANGFVNGDDFDEFSAAFDAGC